ncbi:uncharacterized protein Z520_03569 [Fonsecaea multimorphosa CBS 102226]|uniref:Uncharacterized protein n=1 Tax=Fonsecaea multimorphosa CBS 102226 TaxID=1442371 RepID=A0A0D2K558_9EURO|nr:uncharacterized protein Z520_03569 [Fonsecaea multimorphosa CBS 102226]KIY00903.1 hypothetical protein Z520_03569 [Fonsecaea multimorphosa CBS 102226]OAL27729.1 hypothetical protein AYO22_03395 [Fonsecaea multimorphosa]
MAETSTPKSGQLTDLLWVNHDALNMKAQPHRQRVFSHIQQRYRPWQRRDSALKLRKSVQLPASGSREQSSESEEDRSESTSTSPASSCTSYSLDSLASSDKSPGLVAYNVKFFQGNSDPFNAYPVSISPRINVILRFYRDIVIPSQYHTGLDGWRTLDAAVEDWRDVVRSLHEKGGALGFLGRWAQVASNVTNNSELATQSLRFRSQSTSMLLKKLQTGSGLVSKSSYWHVITLYMAEAQAGNADGAWLHAKMLSRALKYESQHGQVDITSLRSFMYNEACACCMFLRKPVLDYDGWVPEVFKIPWAEGRKGLPAMQLSFATSLDPAIEDEFLMDMFMQQRESLAVWRHGSERGDGLPPAVFTWWCSSHLVKQMRLLKYALDRLDEAKEGKGPQSHLHKKNAYLALTAVYWTRLIAGDETLLGKEIYQTKKPLRTLTRQLLEKEQLVVEFTGSMKYANARLWALYVGAQAEHDHLGIQQIDENWFSAQLSLLAAQMNLTSWEAVRSILDGFLDCDVVEPHGSQFVPALLSRPSSTTQGDSRRYSKTP